MSLALRFEPDSETPLHKALTQALIDAIRNGRLAPGDRVPSTRDLANQLSVSRITVVRSYNDLVSQGIFETAQGKPTRVSLTAARVLVGDKVPPTSGQSETYGGALEIDLSDYGQRLVETLFVGATSADQPLLNYGAPAAADLPLDQWRRILLRCCKEYDPSILSYDADPFGYYPLRVAIAGFLARARGVQCSADQVVIFATAQQALDMLIRLCVSAGDMVAIENVSYASLRSSLGVHGAQVMALDVSLDGAEVEQLNADSVKVKIACVSPARQDPLGVPLSSAKRAGLVAWARRHSTLIVEDDYDGFICFGHRAEPALQGDAPESVVYLSTFWKLCYPIVSLGFAVVPKRLIPAFYAAKLLAERKTSLIESAALTAFIEEGHLERHVKKLRDTWEERRQTLIFALSQAFGKTIEISKNSGGTHLVIWLDDSYSSETILECALAAALPVVSSEPYYLRGARANEFLIGFGHLTTQQLSENVSKFKELLDRPERCEDMIEN